MQSQVPQFKAQPLPDFDSVLLPEKKKLEATKPEPFRLLIDERGAVKSTRLEQMVPLLSSFLRVVSSPIKGLGFNDAVWDL